MLGEIQIFSTDFGHIFDTAKKSAASIFNEAILPRVNKLHEEALPPVEIQQPQQSFNPFAPKPQQDFVSQLPPQRQSAPVSPVAPQENYDAPIASPVAEESAPSPAVDEGLKIKLSNYGYDSDSSPDYNSNVLKIGHANNKLESGKSAALTKSLAQRYGLKTGDMFEAFTASGEVLRRRYDDTVPTTYKGRRLPETVDLYELGGSNNFSGIVTGIRPLSTR